MHVISRKKLREFWEKHPDSKASLKHWYRIATRAEWKIFAELRENIPGADLVGSCVVFNIGGNNYRLITYINFRWQKLYTLHVLTHQEYDREKWKSDCDC